MHIQLPALTGSDKQVAWAETIRNSFVEFYKESRPSYVAKDVAAHTEATYWIEHRYGMGVTNADQKAIQKLWKVEK